MLLHGGYSGLECIGSRWVASPHGRLLTNCTYCTYLQHNLIYLGLVQAQVQVQAEGRLQ